MPEVNASGEEFYFKDYLPDNIPEDAFRGPEDKYIGQVDFSSDICLPVCIYPQDNKAIGERGGKQEFSENIRIMCTKNLQKFYWDPINFACVTAREINNAVVGGYQDDYNLYVGKAYHDDEWKIGKVVPNVNPYKGLQIWNSDGDCEIISIFDILKFTSP